MECDAWSDLDVVDINGVSDRRSHTAMRSQPSQSVQTLSPDILDVVLPQLPKLNSLHIMNCPKVDQSAVLLLLVHTPELQSLAFTSYVRVPVMPHTLVAEIDFPGIFLPVHSCRGRPLTSPAASCD